MVVDRNIAVISSNNIQDNDNLEMVRNLLDLNILAAINRSR